MVNYVVLGECLWCGNQIVGTNGVEIQTGLPHFDKDRKPLCQEKEHKEQKAKSAKRG